jgi:hypothetical protein
VEETSEPRSFVERLDAANVADVNVHIAATARDVTEVEITALTENDCRLACGGANCLADFVLHHFCLSLCRFVLCMKYSILARRLSSLVVQKYIYVYSYSSLDLT